MAIEDQLERIANSLEILSGQAAARATRTEGARTEEAPAAATAPVEPAPEEVTHDTVRDELRNHAREHGRDSAIAVLAEFGVKAAGNLKPEQLRSAVDRLRKPPADAPSPE